MRRPEEFSLLARFSLEDDANGPGNHAKNGDIGAIQAVGFVGASLSHKIMLWQRMNSVSRDTCCSCERSEASSSPTERERKWCSVSDFMV